jgi:predicted anti-sigma-YlaC factor YlaD
MNCRNIEELLYRYQELASAEKKMVDEHLTQCETCNQLARQLFFSHRIIRKAASHKPALRNPHVITQRIMNAIELEKRRSIVAVLSDYLDSIFVRYAISVISVILITFFVYEQQPANYSTSERRNTISGISKGTVLESGKFMNTYVKQRENKNKLNSRYSYYKSKFD